MPIHRQGYNSQARSLGSYLTPTVPLVLPIAAEIVYPTSRTCRFHLLTWLGHTSCSRASSWIVSTPSRLPVTAET